MVTQLKTLWFDLVYGKDSGSILMKGDIFDQSLESALSYRREHWMKWLI